MIKCPVCSFEMDACGMPDAVPHPPQVDLRTINDVCAFSRTVFPLWRWLQIAKAFEQLSRMNAQAK